MASGFPGGSDGKDPLEEEMATHSVFLPGESHGQRSLAGCSPWGRTESDTNKPLHFASVSHPRLFCQGRNARMSGLKYTSLVLKVLITNCVTLGKLLLLVLLFSLYKSRQIRMSKCEVVIKCKLLLPKESIEQNWKTFSHLE